MNRIPGLFRAGLVSLLGVSLNERAKRLIFLASLSARFNDRNDIDRATLHRLNQLMRLCSTEAAMDLPVHLSKVIWRGKTIDVITAEQQILTPTAFTKEHLQQLAARVLNTMPKWLRYGPEAAMQDDVARLLEHRSVLLVAV